MVKNYYDDNNTIYFLSDVIDTGLAIMNKILEGPRIIYIKDNHEDMMYQYGTWSHYKQVLDNPIAQYWIYSNKENTIKTMCKLNFE